MQPQTMLRNHIEELMKWDKKTSINHTKFNLFAHLYSFQDIHRIKPIAQDPVDDNPLPMPCANVLHQ